MKSLKDVKLSKPAENLQDYSILIYGKEKIGKTSLCAQFPDTFFLMCEPGGRALSVYQKPVNSWKNFVGWIDALDADRKTFKTVVVDTVDLCFKMCQEHVLKENNIKHGSDLDWGKGWALIRKPFELEMQRLLKLGRGVIFLSHATTKEIKRAFKDPIEQIIPTMSKIAREILEPMIDIWAYYHYVGKEDTRSLKIRGTADISAGCRLQRNFVGVDEINMGSSPQQAYKNFIKAFQQTATTKTDVVKKAVLKLKK